MLNLLMGIFAFATLLAFLAILVIHVPRTDLMVVIGITVLLAGWDLYTSFRPRR